MIKILPLALILHALFSFLSVLITSPCVRYDEVVLLSQHPMTSSLLCLLSDVEAHFHRVHYGSVNNLISKRCSFTAIYRSTLAESTNSALYLIC